jgi:hypothetical protein
MILPKAIDIQSLQCRIAQSSDIPFISFGFSVYENFNTDTGLYDSYVSYDSLCTYNEFSYQIQLDSMNGLTNFFSVKVGNAVFNFSNGEYFDFNGYPINLQYIQAVIGQTLGI